MMNEKLRVLFDEHDVIVNAAGMARTAESLLPGSTETYEKVTRGLIRFFRLYADRYHHYKEEEILFPEISRRSQLAGEGIVSEMLDNHGDFRAMVAEAESHLDARQYVEAQEVLKRYTAALLDHIAAENDELFQMAGALLSEAELERVRFRFEDCDRELQVSGNGNAVPAKSELIGELSAIGKLLTAVSSGV